MNNGPQQKYDRASSGYDLFELPMERMLFSGLRRKALSQAQGKVLEIGIGTGKNLPYYPASAEVTGIDISSGMLTKAKQRKAQLHLDNVTLRQMDAQHLEFGDNIFDTIVSTFVFCTVPHPLKGLREAYRVLKPGGKAIFVEHMRSKNILINSMLAAMHLISWPLLGTSMLRRTGDNIRKAGFRIESVENHLYDVVRLIVAAK